MLLNAIFIWVAKLERESLVMEAKLNSRIDKVELDLPGRITLKSPASDQSLDTIHARDWFNLFAKEKTQE
jgi:hypothetical protein